ncbi:MAG: response regulator [Myxococcota bacterium]|jgi:DNA-binding NtrC family response regulator
MVTEYRVLVVDDEDDSLEIMRSLLKGTGCRVTTAHTGAEALRALETEKFDFLIADMVMTGLNGIELLREVRRRGNNTRFIMVTAYGEMESYIEVMNLGAVEYLSKPVNQNNLAQVMDKAIKAGGAT